MNISDDADWPSEGFKPSTIDESLQWLESGDTRLLGNGIIGSEPRLEAMKVQCACNNCTYMFTEAPRPEFSGDMDCNNDSGFYSLYPDDMTQASTPGISLTFSGHSISSTDLTPPTPGNMPTYGQHPDGNGIKGGAWPPLPISKQKLEVLEHAFAYNPKPSHDDVDFLAKALQLDDSVLVRFWHKSIHMDEKEISFPWSKSTLQRLEKSGFGQREVLDFHHVAVWKQKIIDRVFAEIISMGCQPRKSQTDILTAGLRISVEQFRPSYPADANISRGGKKRGKENFGRRFRRPLTCTSPPSKLVVTVPQAHAPHSDISSIATTPVSEELPTITLSSKDSPPWVAPPIFNIDVAHEYECDATTVQPQQHVDGSLETTTSLESAVHLSSNSRDLRRAEEKHSSRGFLGLQTKTTKRDMRTALNGLRRLWKDNTTFDVDNEIRMMLDDENASVTDSDERPVPVADSFNYEFDDASSTLGTETDGTDDEDDSENQSLEEEVAAILGPAYAHIAPAVITKLTLGTFWNLSQSEASPRQCPSGSRSPPSSSVSQTPGNVSSPNTTLSGSSSGKRKSAGGGGGGGGGEPDDDEPEDPDGDKGPPPKKKKKAPSPRKPRYDCPICRKRLEMGGSAQSTEVCAPDGLEFRHIWVHLRKAHYGCEICGLKLDDKHADKTHLIEREKDRSICDSSTRNRPLFDIGIDVWAEMEKVYDGPGTPEEKYRKWWKLLNPQDTEAYISSINPRHVDTFLFSEANIPAYQEIWEELWKAEPQLPVLNGGQEQIMSTMVEKFIRLSHTMHRPRRQHRRSHPLTPSNATTTPMVAHAGGGSAPFIPGAQDDTLMNNMGWDNLTMQPTGGSSGYVEPNAIFGSTGQGFDGHGTMPYGQPM